MATPVISIAQMREWENATWKKGQTEAEVIRRVGRTVAELALRLTMPGDLVIVLAGRGNNGADARAALEQLEERRVDVLQVRDPSEDFSELETLLALRPALVIDGLFGIGVNRPLGEHWIRFIRRINEARLSVLSIDVPSGLDADTGRTFGAAIEATVTLTVGAPKAGLVRNEAAPYVGRLEVADNIGLVPCPIESEFNWTDSKDFVDFPPRRKVTAHKGSCGHLAIVAGSRGYHGAAVLAARGAQRAHPGLITLFPSESAYLPCASQLQAVMVQPWPEQLSVETFDAFLFGPGLAGSDVSDKAIEILRSLWTRSANPLVVDASALSWIPAGSCPPNVVRVITPHPGEAARLLGVSVDDIQSDRAGAVRQLSKKFSGCWVVLKGHQTITGRETGPLFINSTGNPLLAQGGSGDLLAGFIAGLLVQPGLQSDPLRTIRYAVWIHGAAADQLSRFRPNWVIEDLASELGK